MTRKVNYHESAFWQERYKQNVCEWYEWLAPPNQINTILQEKMPPNSNILQLGCGSSNLAEKLTTMQHEVTCVDFSKEIVKNRSKNNSNSKITYKLHNIQEKLPFEDGSFDVIIEKNTIDCLFCQENFLPNVLRCMKECYRVLKDNGTMISITHGKEKNRRFFYRNRFSPFSIQVLPLPNRKPNQAQVLIFVLSKGQRKEGRAIEEGSQNNEEENNLEQLQKNEEQNNASQENQDLDNAEQKQNEENNEEDKQEEQQQQKQKEQSNGQEGQEEYQFDELQNQQQQQDQ